MKVKVNFKSLVIFSALFVLLCCGSAFAEKWKTYTNERFGYSVKYQDIFSSVKEPDNGDGVWMKSKGDKYNLTISGGYNVLMDDAETMLQARREDVHKLVPGSDESGPGWFRLISIEEDGKDGNDKIVHQYGIVDDENWASFTLVYPEKEGKRFSAAAEIMEKSLSLPSSK